MLSFLNTLASAIGWLVIFAVALALLAFVIGLIAYWILPDDSLASPEDLDDPDLGDEREPWPEFREPETDAVITGTPGPDTYSDLPPAWISPESIPEPVQIAGDPTLEALGAQSAAWLPPPPASRVNGHEIIKQFKPMAPTGDQPCAD